MRFQSLMLLAAVATVALAREDTAELCTGALSCDPGYCCSSHGFCGRSAMHCGHSNGCNSDKGSCGVIILDKQDMPRVITYDEFSPDTMAQFAESLESEGSHVSPEEAKSNKTIKSILQQGLVEKEKMLASNPKPATPTAAVAIPAPADKKDGLPTTGAPVMTNEATKAGAGVAAFAMAAAVLFL